MLETPHVVRVEERPTAVVRLRVPRDELQHAMGPAIAEVMGTLTGQGVTPTGPLFSHHLRMQPDVFDLEVGVPVDRDVRPEGRVQASMLPAATVVRATYHGPYEGLGAAWGELDAWVQAEGHVPAEHLWESYLTGPESSRDPDAWRTELNRPLVEPAQVDVF